MMTIEDVFLEWSQYAVWMNDRTEVALWNAETKDYTDCFEVLRSGSACYFRTIPRLTRQALTHGVPEDSPLRFTETEEQRREWLGEKAQEDWRALGEAMSGGAGGWRVTHRNLNDGTVEGLEHEKFRAFSVQYHPEASPGPCDSKYLFDKFVEMIK